MGLFKRSESMRWYGLFVINLMVVSSAVYAYCGPPPRPFQMNRAHTAATASLGSITGAMSAVDATLSTQLAVNNERLMAAIAVLTKQKAVAANQTSEATRAAGQMTAVGMKMINESERVKKARLDFGPEFGQGYQPCKVYTGRTMIAEQASAMDGERRRRVSSEVMAAPGAYGSRIAAQQTLVKDRKEFCTEDQVRTKTCEVIGTHPAADINVATLFEPAIEGEPLYRAKSLFVNHAVGLPDAPVPQRAAKSAATDDYVLSKARKDALISPAINSFKAIQLDSSGVDSAHGASGSPINVMFRNEVARYGGDTEEHSRWAASLTGLVERGALVEILKMKALDLALMERQYRRYERIEANLASLVAMEIEASGISGAVTRTANEAMSNKLREAIK